MPHVAAAPSYGEVDLDYGISLTPKSAINVDLTWPKVAAALSAGKIVQLDSVPAPVFASVTGIKADGKTVTDASITGGQARLSSVAAGFVGFADQNKLVVVDRAGVSGAHLYTTIQSVDVNGIATLAANAGATVSNAEVFFASDDTAAIQALINSAAATQATADLPEGSMGISAPIVTPAGAVSIFGKDVKELYGDGSNINSYGFPTRAPYLKGSVLVQCSPNQDILQLGAQGVSQNVKRLGLRYAGKYQNTGTALKAVSAVVNQIGLMGAVLEDVRCFGHDGAHYGFDITAPGLCRFTGLRAYGGGGMRLYNGTTSDSPGNIFCTDYYSSTFLAGTAHGLYLDGSGAGGNFQYCEFERSQTWINQPSPAIPGTTPPTSAQFCLQHSNGNTMLAIGFDGVDFESNVGSKANFPSGPQSYRTAWPSVALANPAINPFPAQGAAGALQNLRGGRVKGRYSIQLGPAAAAVASTTLSAGIGYGASALPVASSTGFAAGQCVQIDTGANIEYAIVSSVPDGTHINLDTTKMGNFGLVLNHASGATVKAGAACAFIQTNSANGWPGSRRAQIGAPVGAAADAAASLHTVEIDLPVANWVRWDGVNANIVWNSFEDAPLN